MVPAAARRVAAVAGKCFDLLNFIEYQREVQCCSRPQALSHRGRYALGLAQAAPAAQWACGPNSSTMLPLDGSMPAPNALKSANQGQTLNAAGRIVSPGRQTTVQLNPQPGVVQSCASNSFERHHRSLTGAMEQIGTSPP